MKRNAFTLIELLVVIAIIAILAAITFPVVARAKDSAFRGSDMQNMNTLRSALQVYRVDQGGYPPALLGYVTLYSSGPNVGQVIPADQLKSYLYPKRVDSLETLRPSYERAARTVTTLAVWPTQDPRAAGSAPVFDADGNGILNAADDNACARQLFGPTQTVQRLDPVSNTVINAQYYKVSGYDVATVKTPTGNRSELRYALFWSGWGLGDATCSPSGTPGSALDDPRQLGYSDPPENTVVTWNSFFRQYNADNTTQRVKFDIVLTLGGGARMSDSRNISEQSWRTQP
jgi:prepilin-type N-terminal cleavage/methylation domain-containing protein